MLEARRRYEQCPAISSAHSMTTNQRAGEAQEAKISTLSISAMRLVGESRVRVCPYLGSAMSADCRTRPQYVERSYWDAGKSRFPGNEADILPV